MPMLFDLFEKYEKEAERVIATGNVYPAYDYVLKCSHTFNLLDARGAISVSERTAFIGRVRKLARLGFDRCDGRGAEPGKSDRERDPVPGEVAER